MTDMRLHLMVLLATMVTASCREPEPKVPTAEEIAKALLDEQARRIEDALPRREMLISTEPSSATVWVNGVKHNDTTPTTIQVVGPFVDLRLEVGNCDPIVSRQRMQHVGHMTRFIFTCPTPN